MSFFEPLPPPPPRTTGEWVAPVWDRPSEGTLPSLLPLEEVVLRTDDAVAELESLRVYPNGFVVNVTVLFNPTGDQRQMFGPPSVGGPHPMYRFPRIGVRFADGREGGRNAPAFGQNSMRKDDRGVPIDPVVQPTGGGGGQHGFHFGAWVFPLPPDGPVDIFLSFPAFAADEGHVTVDGRSIREAAGNAKVIWS